MRTLCSIWCLALALGLTGCEGGTDVPGDELPGDQPADGFTEPEDGDEPLGSGEGMVTGRVVNALTQEPVSEVSASYHICECDAARAGGKRKITRTHRGIRPQSVIERNVARY